MKTRYVKVQRAFRHGGKVYEPGQSAELPESLAVELKSGNKVMFVEPVKEPVKEEPKKTPEPSKTQVSSEKPKGGK